MNNREPAGDLAGKLNAWKVTPAVPADFQREVWQRIAVRESAREEPVWSDPVGNAVDILSRRVYTIAAVGIWLGIALVCHRATESSTRPLR